MQHWTYQNTDRIADLEQGDILIRTDDLLKIFSEVHPHFCDPKYSGFIVATQSCDLVQRKGDCKAAYINLAVVRPLSPQVVAKIVAQVATPIGKGLFRKGDQLVARQLVERILNQNEQAIGLFYLHSDVDSGVAEPSVAFLRVAVAVRAEHYQKLVAARTGALRPEFRAKLGWLIGTLYDRPATPDWQDCQPDRMPELAAALLNDAGEWIPDEIVNVAASKKVALETLGAAERESLRPPPPLERALEEVRIELEKIADPARATDPAEFATKLVNRLRNNGRFRRLVRTDTAT